MSSRLSVSESGGDRDVDGEDVEGLSNLLVAFVGFEADAVDTFFVGDAFFFSSIDRIVGGSCIGSPARMSFFALRMGTQQT